MELPPNSHDKENPYTHNHICFIAIVTNKSRLGQQPTIGGGGPVLYQSSGCKKHIQPSHHGDCGLRAKLPGCDFRLQSGKILPGTDHLDGSHRKRNLFASAGIGNKAGHYFRRRGRGKQSPGARVEKKLPGTALSRKRPL